MAKVDVQYKNICQQIIKENNLSLTRPFWKDGVQAKTIKKFGIVSRYDLQKEFPALTLRPIYFKNCVDQLLWIWVKNSNNIKDLNSKIWDNWADKNGSIGKAYGYQLSKVIDFGDFIGTQVDRLLYLLKNNKSDRRMIVNMYNHEQLKDMQLHPCAYSITVNVLNNKLNMILHQRSLDILVAGNWDVVQYAVLAHMLAQVSDLEVGQLLHVISDAHIYDRHVDIVKKLILREPLPAPTFWINKNIKNFKEFTINDFKLINYNTHKQIKKIEVAV